MCQEQAVFGLVALIGTASRTTWITERKMPAPRAGILKSFENLKIRRR